jgi:hypothetical protein
MGALCPTNPQGRQESAVWKRGRKSFVILKRKAEGGATPCRNLTGFLGTLTQQKKTHEQVVAHFTPASHLGDGLHLSRRKDAEQF